MSTEEKHIQCSYIKKNGKQCKNRIKKGDKYCHLHRSVVIRLIDGIMKNRLIKIIVVIVAILGCGATFYFGIISKDEEILEFLKQQDVKNYDKLIKKYPEGYILLAIDHTEEMFPYNSRFEDEFMIEWENKSVTLDNRYVTFTYPTIIDKKYSGNLLRENTITMDRGLIGIPITIYQFGTIASSVELIYDGKDGLIIAVGFADLGNEE
jgi:hypothetical protein